MKLETKLGYSSGVLILAMLISAGTAHLRVWDANRKAQDIMLNRMPMQRASSELSAHMGRSVRALQSNLLFGSDREGAARFRIERADELQQAEKVLSWMETEENRLNSPEDVARLKQIRTIFDQTKALQERVEIQNEQMAFDRVFEDYKQVFELHHRLSVTLYAIIHSQNAQADQEAGSLERANTLTVFTLWLTTLAGALVGGLISTLLGRHITRAIDLVASRANSIAAGDLTGAELQLRRRDQVGMLAEAMNRMQASLGGIIGTVADTAGALTGSAVSMRQASDHIHQRMDQQSQQTQQAATAMQEMSASIAEVSRHTQSAAETARSAAQTAREGGAIVKQVLGSMHSIAMAVSDTGSTVGLLGEDSRRISQIVTVIDEIARKTNLLALNAAIEAARAGDQGRGFAVVAGEVRRLAESTAQATGEIATMIGGIQQRTRTAIASMEQGTGTVKQGVETTTQAGEALERIIGMAERVDRMITQIAIAAAQQAMAADQSSASLDSIHSLSNENVSEMATTAAGIETLRGTAVTLEQQVDRFQVQAA
jgi:methyl-accepting chemotaxis protein